ncbi:MAG: DUF4870 domain-containing protein [Pseudobacteriovorax sp.]|nr:DUF4870 domain-containing protein [Pseudobacteriovorax sp.]
MTEQVSTEQVAPKPSLDPKTESNIATFIHLSIILGGLIPFANIIAPLVAWLKYKDESPKIVHNSLECLNFNITLIAAIIIASLASVILIGIPFLFILPIYAVVMAIVATIKASNGEEYRYPFIFRLVK